MGRPHSHRIGAADLGPRAMSEGWGHDTDYFIGPGIHFLNWQVVVEYMFLELF